MHKKIHNLKHLNYLANFDIIANNVDMLMYYVIVVIILYYFIDLSKKKNI